MTDNEIIIESLKRSIAELQNHLENTKNKYRRAKENKDFNYVITYRNMKKKLERKIKRVAEVLKRYE